MINLAEKSFCIFGLKGSGKSTLLDYIASCFGDRCLVYDTLHEAPADAAYDFIQPPNRYDSFPLIQAIRDLRSGKTKYSLFMIDECNRFAPSKPAPLFSDLADLNDQNRHYHLSVGYVARRPTQLNQDLTELANYLFFYSLSGKNDIKYLEDIATGLGNVVANLHPFHFVFCPPKRSDFQLMAPVTPNANFIRRARSI